MLAVDSTSHLAASLLLLTAWGVLRVGNPSRLFIRAVESLALVGSCVLFVAMGLALELLFNRPEYSVILALNFVTCSRAVYVPSSGTRTATLSVLIGAALLAGTYYGYVDIDLTLHRLVDPNLNDVTSRQLALRQTTSMGIWWLLSSGLAVATSKVIYGLRKAASATRQLGQYRLDRKIGAGGMGVVYQAHHAMLRRPSAIKLLPPEKAGEAAIQRFEREVKLTARLRHPNTITIYDYGRTPDGIFYYAMELLDGATLEEIIEAGGPLPPSRVVHILSQASGALAEAHELGLIHRDIKPSNIMLCNQGGLVDIAKVLDFGLVKDIGPAEGTQQTAPNLTQADSITGTPLYMAPEAIVNPGSVDARSDLYALGAVGYFLLTGEHVFSGNSVIEICSCHLHQTPRPISERTNQAVPAELERLLMQCLNKQPAERPTSALAFVEALEACHLPRWERSAAQQWWTNHPIKSTQTGQSRGAMNQTVMIDLAHR